MTKELQTTIKGGDEGRKAAENAILERQMEHSKKLHDLKVCPATISCLCERIIVHSSFTQGKAGHSNTAFFFGVCVFVCVGGCVTYSHTLLPIQIEDMKKRLFKGHKQIREKEMENGKLDEYVQDLAVSVAQREKIIKVRGRVAPVSLFGDYK